MESKVNFAAVGVFVIALGVALIAGILWLASGGAVHKRFDLYLALVNESVSGLNLNAPVKYRGVDVGKVRDIALDPNTPEQVRLTLAIERGTPIKEDTEAVLKTQGLTGIAYVELSGGSRESPTLHARAPERYPEIRTKPSLSARLENVITNVLANLDRTSANVNALLSEENRAAFNSALADIAAVTHTVAARKSTIDAGIASAARAFDNGARAAAQFGPMIERIARSADAIESMANEAKRTSASAGKTIDAVGSDVKRLTGETLPELERLIGEMSDLTASLRRLSEQYERSPGGLLFGRSAGRKGPGE
jgi:phospholipid/cholesterol/gamma-HCH transport system substrate-binding protein